MPKMGDIFKGNSPPPTLPMHCATRNVPRVRVPLSLVARKALFRVRNIGGLASQAGVLRRGDRLRHERLSIAILRRSDINGENKRLDA